MTTYVPLDTETTGFEPGSRLLEIAAIKGLRDDEIAGVFDWLAHPRMPIPPDAAAVNGVTAECLVDAPTAGDVLADWIDWLPSDAVIVAHNAPFDCSVIAWEAARHSVSLPELRVIDTLPLARKLKETKGNGLQALIGHYQIERLGDAHSALSDADACRQYLLLHLAKAAEPVPWADVTKAYRYIAPDLLPPMLRPLFDLVRDGGSFAFRYQDAKGAITERTITPYGWADTPKGITFHSLCHLRQERRTFYAERVLEAAAVAAA